MRVWSHVHSNFSYDSELELESIKELARSHEVAIVLLSEHSDELSSTDYQELISACAKCVYANKDVLLVPGIEVVSISGCHILCFGLERWIEPLRDEETIIREAKEQGAFTVLSHPDEKQLFDAQRRMLEYDAVEVWNVKRCRMRPDKKLCQAVRDTGNSAYGWRAFTGLDTHDSEDFQDVWLSLEREVENAAELFELFRRGQYSCQGKGIEIFANGVCRSSVWTQIKAEMMVQIRRFLKFFSPFIRKVCPGLFTKIRKYLRKNL